METRIKVIEMSMTELERILTIRLAEAEKEIERFQLRIAYLETLHEEDK